MIKMGPKSKTHRSKQVEKQKVSFNKSKAVVLKPKGR